MAEKRVKSTNHANVFMHEQTDRGTEQITRNMGDLAKIENYFLPVDQKVWPDIAIREAEFLSGQKRDDNLPNGTAKTIGLNDNDKRSGPPVPGLL
jgi:hypothetical protein